MTLLSRAAGVLPPGTAVLRKFSDQHMIMTDAVGLHIMRMRKAKVCWSTDFHMGLTGVPLVIDLL